MADSTADHDSPESRWHRVTVALVSDADQHVHVQLYYASDDTAPRHDRRAAAGDNADSTVSPSDAQTQTVWRANNAVLGDTAQDGSKQGPADSAGEDSCSPRDAARQAGRQQSSPEPGSHFQQASPMRCGSGSNTSSRCCSGSGGTRGTTSCRSAEGSGSPFSSCGDSDIGWTGTGGATLRLQPHMIADTQSILSHDLCH